MKIVKNNKDHVIYIVIEEDIIIKNAADFCLPYLMVLYTDLKERIYVRTQKEFWEDFDIVDVSYTTPTTEEKSIRDMVSPEVLKKAKEFTEMIKDGTIKNRHTTIYEDEIKWDRLSKDTEDMESNFPGFGKVFAEVNKAWDKDNKSINQQCYLTYLYLKGWYDRNESKERFVTGENKMEEGLMDGGNHTCGDCGKTVFGSVELECDCEYKKEVTQEGIDTLLTSKPQFTEEEAIKLIQIINNTKGTKFPRTIKSLKDAGYIIPVKSEEPLIVHNVMSYKGKNYLRQFNRGCNECYFHGIECHKEEQGENKSDNNIMAFGHKTNCDGTNTIWKLFDDIIIDDSLACMRKDIGDIYIIDNEGKYISPIYGVTSNNEVVGNYIGIFVNECRLASAEELQEYFKDKK
jgi:hypothetical protein